MSAVLSELVGLGSSVLSNFLTIIPQGQFITSDGNSLTIPATLEEISTDLITVTDHPVEAGAEISDHAYYRPAELVMRCGWSNSNSESLVGAIASLFSGGGSSLFSNLFGSLPSTSGGMSISDFVSGVYTQLLAIQQSLVPFTVVTSIRQYTNMMMTSLIVTRDKKTSQALMVTANLRQVILVSTATTSTAPIANLADPASNSDSINLGQQNLDPNATPSPGGSPGPLSWPPGSDEALIAQATQ